MRRSMIMKLDDRLEIRVVVATLDRNQNIIDIFYDWRDVDEYSQGHRFGFVIVDVNINDIPNDMDYADFYLTISDAMNDFNRINLVKQVLEQSRNGRTIIELASMFNMREKRVEKILYDYGDR